MEDADRERAHWRVVIETLISTLPDEAPNFGARQDSNPEPAVKHPMRRNAVPGGS